jgi:hypothetical protein
VRKFLALFLTTSLLIPTQAYAATTKPTSKPSASKAKLVKAAATKKPVVKKKVVKRKKKLPDKKPLKWPPGGFEKKGELYAKTATPKELLIAGTENKFIQSNLIEKCHLTACLGIFVGSETGCDWWEINSNVLGIDPNNPTERIILGSLITSVSGSKAKTIKAILLISNEPIADGLGIGAYTANCRMGTPTGKIPSNIYTVSSNRS